MRGEKTNSTRCVLRSLNVNGQLHLRHAMDAIYVQPYFRCMYHLPNPHFTEGPLSAASTPILASKYAFFRIFWGELQDWHILAKLQKQYFWLFLLNFHDFCNFWSISSFFSPILMSFHRNFTIFCVLKQKTLFSWDVKFAGFRNIFWENFRNYCKFCDETLVIAATTSYRRSL